MGSIAFAPIEAIRCLSRILVFCCCLSVQLLIAQSTDASISTLSKSALVPFPREIHTGAMLPLAGGITISATGDERDDKVSAEDLISTLKDRGIAADGGRGDIKIVLLREETKRASAILSSQHLTFSSEMRDEGYAIITEGKTTYDIAATAAGLYYGVQTIKQLVTGRERNAMLQGAVIRDWPAMKYRGLSDDLSRGPISTLAFQKHKIQVFSEYKMNIYSPYFEDSLAYKGDPLLAPPGGAMTRADVEDLARYAQQYHVTIVPEQEAFGHMHHTLMYETYSHLAETPHGSALAPGQEGSIQLIKRWFAEIASMFPGPFIHIGADEVNELGLGQTKPLIAQEGAAKVYADFLNQIYTALQPLHKRLLFWGDIAMKEPELVKTLPKDMIAVAWEYGPRPEGFEKWLRPFIDAGMETWVAPGVNDWSRIYPNNYEALLNIQEFVRDGQRFGSTGELNTVWNSDDDEEGLFNNDWYSVLFGAAAGWQSGTSSIPQFQDAYGLVFHGDTTGKINEAQMELTAAQLSFRKAGFQHGVMTSVFWADPWSQGGQRISAKLLPVASEIRLHAERAIILIKEAEASGPLRESDALEAMELAARRIDFVGFKFQAAQEIATQYNLAYQKQNGRHNVGSPLFHVDYLYEDLTYGYGLLHDLYEQAWRRENRTYSLHNVMVHYDLNTRMWMERATRLSDAEAQFSQEHKLPKPEEMGIPSLALGDSK